MSRHENSNIRPYRREKLEPEIAAMSVALSEDEPPTLIVNIDDPYAKSAIKKVIIWIGVALGGLAEQVRRNSRRSVVLAMAGTATATAAATVGATSILRHEPAPTPPAAVSRVVTLRASPVTTTITAKPPRPKPTKATPKRSHASATAPTAAPTVKPATPHPTSKRVPSPQPAPSKTPTVKQPSSPPPSPRPSVRKDESVSEPTPASAAESARTTPRATVPPSSAADEPEPGTAQPVEQTPDAPPARDCAIQVNLPPIADVCVKL